MNKKQFRNNFVKSCVSHLKKSGYYKATAKNLFTDPLYRRSVLEFAQECLCDSEMFDDEYRAAINDFIQEITKHYDNE